MHHEAYEAVRRMAREKWEVVNTPSLGLDLGGGDYNGTARELFPGVIWTGLDQVPGPGVDIVADIYDWEPNQYYDLVLCTEVLEHAYGWPRIIAKAHRALVDGGLLILTCASDHRMPHGATGAPAPAPGEHYANVSPAELESVVGALFDRSRVSYAYPPGDAYCWAQKRRIAA
jgi:SAM-dependent methyltransferase